VTEVFHVDRLCYHYHFICKKNNIQDKKVAYKTTLTSTLMHCMGLSNSTVSANLWSILPPEGIFLLLGKSCSMAFSALTLLVGRQEGHPACKKIEWWGAGVVIWLELGADLHMADATATHCLLLQ